MSFGEAPGFWWRPSGWQAALLSPAAALYGGVAAYRLDHGARAKASLPVLCIGNFTAGGGGKTPTALALGREAIAMGLRPGFLSRGHGGTAKTPLLVDPARHDAATVGDEPLLLAGLAPTAIVVDRQRGAALLGDEAGCDLVVMDDGFQSARLRPDFALLVIDAVRGLGNGRVIPAGPLRAPFESQIRHADALLVVGDGQAADWAARQAETAGKPVFTAHLRPLAPERLVGRRCLAFAGIADPSKFYRTLSALGADVVASRDFPDHHPFTDDDRRSLAAAARADRLTMVTTRKDAVRFAMSAEGADMPLEVLDVELVFTPTEAAETILAAMLASYRRRKSV
ncbi:MAG: tetraacyldisaccharide 4'-kinase [Rhizobiaceae bacterium]|nr:tetraacyldisaccharide 4'-kinase [Rhizobiaceae bacterium]